MSHFSALRMQDTSSDYVKATVAGAGPDQKAGSSLEGASPTPFRRVRSFSTSTSESPCKSSSLPFAAHAHVHIHTHTHTHTHTHADADAHTHTKHDAD